MSVIARSPQKNHDKAFAYSVSSDGSDKLNIFVSQNKTMIILSYVLSFTKLHVYDNIAGVFDQLSEYSFSTLQYS